MIYPDIYVATFRFFRIW